MARRSQVGTTNRRGRTVRRARSANQPTERAYDKAFQAWNKGEPINELAASLRVRRGTLRHHLTKRAGGWEAFKALREAGAGGLRNSLGERAKSPRYDKGARVLRVGQRKNWKYRQVKMGKRAEPVAVFVATGRGGSRVEYMPARANQKADVIAEMGNGLPAARLVRFIRTEAEA